MPEASADVLDRELSAGRAPVSLAGCERAVLSRLRTMEEEEFAPYDGGGEGLYHRFFRAVSTGRTLDELLEEAKTKRYTLARLRRLMLHSFHAEDCLLNAVSPGYDAMVFQKSAIVPLYIWRNGLRNIISTWLRIAGKRDIACDQNTFSNNRMIKTHPDHGECSCINRMCMDDRADLPAIPVYAEMHPALA